MNYSEITRRVNEQLQAQNKPPISIDAVRDLLTQRVTTSAHWHTIYAIAGSVVWEEFTTGLDRVANTYERGTQHGEPNRGGLKGGGKHPKRQGQPQRESV